MFGRVTKYFKERGFGFILGENGTSYFVHVKNIQDGILEKNYIVDFNVSIDKSNGKEQACNVIVVESDND